MVELIVGGFACLIDDEDAARVAQYSWHAQPDHPTVYAATSLYPDKRTLFMHTLITGQLGTDHINGDGLDNRRENLRLSTNSQNSMNRRKQSLHKGNPTTSRFKGVTRMRHERTKEFVDKWSAQIKIDGRLTRLGTFTDEEVAARAYDSAARTLFGEFARTNFEVPAA